MAGLVPAIHDFLCEGTEDVDARVKPRHDEPTYALRNFSRSRMLPKMPLGRKMMNSTKSTP
jgi:hypothetical protein